MRAISGPVEALADALIACLYPPPQGTTYHYASPPILTGGLALPAIASAQGQWPDRPVRIIVPWPPGGSTDVLARLLAEQMQARLGQSFLIENRPGAGGNIGTDALTKATPDGYSMAPVTVGGWTINQYLFARMPYDPDRDLQPISMHWTLPNVFIASTTHCPATTAAEFITWGRARRQLAERGTTPAGGGPVPYGALIRAEVERWGRVVREGDIRVD